MVALRALLFASLLATSLLVFAPGVSAGECGDDNGIVVDDVRDTLRGDVQCGSVTDPCFQDSTCPRSCGGGPDSMVTWLVGPIYC